MVTKTNTIKSEVTKAKDDLEAEKKGVKETTVEAQQFAGGGYVLRNFIRVDPSIVEIIARNSPVKTIKGSQKHLIDASWSGALFRYFYDQLTFKNFSYDVNEDEFSCAITL